MLEVDLDRSQLGKRRDTYCFGNLSRETLGETYPTPAIMTDVGQSKLGKAGGSTLKPWLPLECNGDSNLGSKERSNLLYH
ncbi:hypothetical protein CsSME_00001513 [Camellia sinensis var. sinensis]